MSAQRLKSRIRNGPLSTADAIKSILDGEWEAEDPLDVSPVAFLLALFRTELTEEEREIVRDGLLQTLAEFPRSGRSWSAGRMSGLLYLLQETRTTRVARGQARHLLTRAADSAIHHKIVPHNSLLLGALADEGLIAEVERWESYYRRVGADGSVPCFVGIAGISIVEAFRWLDRHIDSVNLDHVEAGGLPVVVDRASLAVAVSAVDRAGLKPETREFLQTALRDLGADVEAVGAGASHVFDGLVAVLSDAAEKLRVSQLRSLIGDSSGGFVASLEDAFLGFAFSERSPSRREAAVEELPLIAESQLQPREIISAISGISDSEVVPGEVLLMVGDRER